MFKKFLIAFGVVMLLMLSGCAKRDWDDNNDTLNRSIMATIDCAIDGQVLHRDIKDVKWREGRVVYTTVEGTMIIQLSGVCELTPR